MNHLGLFEGIGGFSLAARWMGWNTVAWCEWDKACQRVLRHHFPEAKEHYDIKETDFTQYNGTIDIITGGFPCQPYSQAGKRLGKEDDRHLWPEMLRAIREVEPRWVVGENVSGLITWNGGMVFDEVQADLEAEGYEVQAYVLPAVSVNAPHRRDRVWIVAYSNKEGLPGPIYGHGEVEKVHSKSSNIISSFGAIKQFDTEGDCGELRNGDGIPNWMDRIGQLGNAIVPQVAYQIFKAIEQYESTT
jgi:DNA-cytosine methyltransferase